jgi:hypothetical protein
VSEQKVNRELADLIITLKASKKDWKGCVRNLTAADFVKAF